MTIGGIAAITIFLWICLSGVLYFGINPDMTKPRYKSGFKLEEDEK